MDRCERRLQSARQRLQFSIFALVAMIAISAVLLKFATNFPFQAFLAAVVFAIAAVAIVLYVGELVILGWIVDLVLLIVAPKLQADQAPLEYEQRGEVLIVKLSDNIVTVGQCLSMQRQLNRLIEEHHYDFILDFVRVRNISRRFRGIMVRFMKAARKEAESLGRPFRPIDLPRGEVFRVFDNRELRDGRNAQARRAWMGGPLFRS